MKYLHCFLALIFALTFGVTAHSEEGAGPTSVPAASERTERAVRLAYEAKERFEGGDFNGALERFRAAAEIASTPVFDLYIARSQKALGHFIEAKRAYEKALVHRVEDENQRFVVAQNEARTELSKLETMLPRLRVLAPRLAPSSVPRVRLDDRELSWPIEGLAVNPGVHVLTATFDDEEFAQELTFSPGKEVIQRLPFREGQNANGTSLPPSHSTPNDARRQNLRTAAWITLGIGAAAVVTGGITGIMTLVAADEWKGHCETNECDDGKPVGEELDDWKRSRGVARVSDIAFVTAGVATLTGVALLLVSKKSPRKTTTAPGVVQVGTRGIGLFVEGSF